MLPCCPFTFNAKFQRRQAELSVFRDYLNFVREVGQQAGFSVAEDRMRIPSTKRVCFVGRPAATNNMSEDRTSTDDTYAERKQLIMAYLHSQPGITGAATSPDAFKPRDKVERVRNCTQLDRTLILGIVAHVVDMCLSAEEGKRLIAAAGSSTWNAGGSLALSDAAAGLAQAGWDLSLLKAECGGLQTLLRNHHAIFLVRGGHVRLRVPGEDAGAGRKVAPRRQGTAAMARVKSKSCWHYFNHPDGCPLTDDKCSWLHVKLDEK